MFLLPAGSFAEIVPIILNVFFGMPTPLSAFQMIFICVLTDVGPSLAMMMEKSEGDLMNKPPRNLQRARLVDAKLLFFAYFFLGIFESFFSMCMYFLYLGWKTDATGPFECSLDKIFFSFNETLPCDKSFVFQNNTKIPNDHYISKDFYLQTGQTVTFVTLVMVQTFGNIFITRTHYLSLFQSFPLGKKHRNRSSNRHSK